MAIEGIEKRLQRFNGHGRIIHSSPRQVSGAASQATLGTIIADQLITKISGGCAFIGGHGCAESRARIRYGNPFLRSHAALNHF
ncbi:MAG: hypothetical protein U0521_04905 [Anaerolineae bacterium]